LSHFVHNTAGFYRLFKEKFFVNEFSVIIFKAKLNLEALYSYKVSHFVMANAAST